MKVQIVRKLTRSPAPAQPSAPGAEPGVPAQATAPRAERLPEQVLRALYAEHGAALLSFTTRLTGGDRQWAEDVVQETLLRAWRSAVRVDDGRPSVRSWLFTVARRVVIDGQRGRAARPAEVGDAALELIPEADQIDNMLSSLAVADALGSLSPAHREVIHELYFRRSKIHEAAETLGIAPGTVKSRAYYALRALRLALEERGITAQH